MASGPITSQQIDGETVETAADFIFLGSKITADGDCSHKIKTLAPWKKSYNKPRQCIKKQRHYFANKGLYSQSYCFPGSRYRCESRTLKEAECWRIDAFKSWCWRRLLRVTWTERKSNQSMIKEINLDFIGRTNAEAEAPILWPTDVKRQLIGIDPDAGEDWGQEEKEARENEMVERHHWLNGHEFE